MTMAMIMEIAKNGGNDMLLFRRRLRRTSQRRSLPCPKKDRYCGPGARVRDCGLRARFRKRQSRTATATAVITNRNRNRNCGNHATPTRATPCYPQLHAIRNCGSHSQKDTRFFISPQGPIIVAFSFRETFFASHPQLRGPCLLHCIADRPSKDLPYLARTHTSL